MNNTTIQEDKLQAEVLGLSIKDYYNNELIERYKLLKKYLSDKDRGVIISPSLILDTRNGINTVKNKLRELENEE